MELLIVIAIGLVCGSFVTLASYRMPLGEDIIIKPSRCPKCEKRLQFLDLWPVLSWLINRGKCRRCGAPVSARYPLTELATAGGFVLVYLAYGITWPGAILALLWVVLMIMIVVDFEHYIIPDEVHYILLPLALLWHYLRATPVENIVTGFAIGAGLGLSLHYGYRILRKKEGLGFGDVKFFGVAGTWLGLYAFVPFLFLSGVLGVVTGLVYRALGKGPIFPFGPSLAVAMFFCVAFEKYANFLYFIEQFIK